MKGKKVASQATEESMTNLCFRFPPCGNHNDGSYQYGKGTQDAEQGKGLWFDPGDLHAGQDGHGYKGDDGIQGDDHTYSGGLRILYGNSQ